MHSVSSLRGQSVVMNSLPFDIEEKRVLRELRIPRLKYVKELKEEGVAKAIKKSIDRAYTLILGRGLLQDRQDRGGAGGPRDGRGV